MKRWMGWVLGCLLVCMVSIAFAETQTFDRSLKIFRAPDVLIQTGMLPAGTEVEVIESSQSGMLHVRYESAVGPLEGWVLPLDADIVPLAVGTQGIVISESLTLWAEPSTSAERVQTMPYGTAFTIDQSDGEWLHVQYHAGTMEHAGWVLRAYVIESPQYHTTDDETPVYAYPAADAKRVALLPAGESHPIIAALDDYIVISLRGASGFVQRQ